MHKLTIVCLNRLLPLLAVLLAVIAATNTARAQMVTGAEMPGYAEAFGLTTGEHATDYAVQEIGVKAGTGTMANVMLPGEHLELTLRLINKTDHRIQAKGALKLIHYRTSVAAGDVWVPHVYKVSDEGATPVEVDLPPSGFQDITVSPEIPERFGGYVLVADISGHGRAFAAALVRSIKPDAGRVQYPTYALDATWPEL